MMTCLTPATADAYATALAAAPMPTRPTWANLLDLRRRIGRAVSTVRLDLAGGPATAKRFARALGGGARLSAAELRVRLCAELYGACADRARGRDVIAIADTSEFSLAPLAARAAGLDADALGVVSDGATPGLKLHAVVCFEAATLAPLGVAHALVFACPPKDPAAAAAAARARPLDERQSARWADGFAAALAGPLARARAVTFLGDAEADQYPLLAGVFATGADGSGPRVDWCFRLAQDRRRRDEARGYWSEPSVRLSDYLGGGGDGGDGGGGDGGDGGDGATGHGGPVREHRLALALGEPHARPAARGSPARSTSGCARAKCACAARTTRATPPGRGRFVGASSRPRRASTSRAPRSSTRRRGGRRRRG